MKIVTHDGKFHADDVLGAAILHLALGTEANIEIIRSRDSDVLDSADILFDTGGVYDPQSGKYDHHQPNPPRRKNGIPNSSASLLWTTYSQSAIRNSLIDQGYENDDFFKTNFDKIWEFMAGHIDYSLLMPTDVVDNGAGKYLLVSDNPSGYCKPLENTKPTQYVHLDSPAFTLSTYLQGFNASWWEDTTPANQDARFFEAVDIAVELLENLIEDAYWFQQSRQMTIDMAIEASNSSTPNILVLDKHIPCKPSFLFADTLIEEEVDIHFIISPSPEPYSSDWKLIGVSSSRKERETTKTPLPTTWGGLEDEKLQKVSGYDDAVFCHWNLSFAVFGSKESAIAVANSLLNHDRISKRVDVSTVDINA